MPTSWPDWPSVDDGPRPFALAALAADGAHLHPRARRRRTSSTGRSRRSSSAIPALVERAIVTLASRPRPAAHRRPRHRQELAGRAARRGVCGNSRTSSRAPPAPPRIRSSIPGTWRWSSPQGQSRDSLIPSPIMTAMQRGALGRFEELTRCSLDVQDALISILSREVRHDPRAEGRRAWSSRSPASTSSPRPTPATAASTSCPPRSSAASTSCTIPIVTNKKTEKEIVLFRTRSCWRGTGSRWRCRPRCSTSCSRPSPTCARRRPRPTSEDAAAGVALSTAEQIGVLEDAVLHGHFFGDGDARRRDAGALAGRHAGAADPGGRVDPEQVLARRGGEERQGAEGRVGTVCSRW